AASRSAPRKTRVSATRAVEEFGAQVAVQKKTAAALAKRKSEVDVKAALAAVPPPPPPPAPPPPPPATVYYDLKKLHAWPAQPVGTWVRWKKTAGETVSTEDHVLATLTDEAAVVRVEAIPDYKATAERAYVFGADRAKVLREETLKVGEAEIPCRVVQSGTTVRWIPKEGPGADRIAIKTQVSDVTVVATELVEEEIPVKGEAKKCLKVTTGDVTVWGHDDVPGFAVRVKTGNETADAVDWGADAATRPVIKKPEERSEKAALAEAERLRVEGWVLLQEVMEAMKDRPDSQDALKSLYYKLETATAMLTRSRDFFLSAKIKSTDPASFDETVSILGRLLNISNRHMESIKPRLRVEP